MMNYQAKESLIEFGAILKREYPDLAMGQLTSAAIELIKLARKLQHYATTRCNTYVYPSRVAKQDESTDAERARIKEVYGIESVEGADARGCSLFVILPSGASNDWGQRGWAVPY